MKEKRAVVFGCINLHLDAVNSLLSSAIGLVAGRCNGWMIDEDIGGYYDTERIQREVTSYAYLYEQE